MPLTVEEFQAFCETLTRLPLLKQKDEAGVVKAVFVDVDHVLEVARQLVPKEPQLIVVGKR